MCQQKGECLVKLIALYFQNLHQQLRLISLVCLIKSLKTLFKTLGCITIALEPIESSMLLEPFWRISLYVTDDAIAKAWET